MQHVALNNMGVNRPRLDLQSYNLYEGLRQET